MPKMVAFLRGINVGGNKKIAMAELRRAVESWGYTNVRTILNSGNVLFDSGKRIVRASTLESNIESEFGMKVGVILRSADELQTMAKTDPFKGINVTADTRLYVTFLSQPPTPGPKLPYASANKEYRILRCTGANVFSVLDLSLGSGTVEAMNILEKEFGKNITTRNWNTIQRILKSWA